MISVMNLLRDTQEVVRAAFVAEGLDPALSVLSPSVMADVADFQCNGVRGAAAKLRLDPQEVAQRITKRLSDDPRWTFSVSGPGYINIRTSSESLEAALQSPLSVTSTNERVVIDFGGPNIAKPMHVGHLRALVIGESLQRILDAAGCDVISDIHLGDWGLQMGLLLAALEGTPPQDITIELLEATYPAASLRSESDPDFRAKADAKTLSLQMNSDPEVRALWEAFVEVSNVAITAELTSLGVDFSIYKGESDVQHLIAPMVEDLVTRGIAITDDGAIKVPLEDAPAVVLLRSNRAALYATTDLATIVDRESAWKPDRIIYLTDNRQALHFKQVFEVAKMAGLTEARLTHVPFGTVNGSNGKPLKTRTGGTPKLNDLISNAIERAAERNPNSAHEVGLAALKFADLINTPSSSYSFDLDRFTSFEGKTGPYLLYQAVRIKSLLTRAVAPGEIKLQTDAERNLAVKLTMGFPAAFQRAFERLSPKEIADHAYDLAQGFATFYNDGHIADNPSRVALAKATLDQLQSSLDLLGISVPERM